MEKAGVDGAKVRRACSELAVGSDASERRRRRHGQRAILPSELVATELRSSDAFATAARWRRRLLSAYLVAYSRRRVPCHRILPVRPPRYHLQRPRPPPRRPSFLSALVTRTLRSTRLRNTRTRVYILFEPSHSTFDIRHSTFVRRFLFAATGSLSFLRRPRGATGSVLGGWQLRFSIFR